MATITSDPYEFQLISSSEDDEIYENLAAVVMIRLTFLDRKFRKDDLISIVASLFEQATGESIFDSRDVLDEMKGTVDDDGNLSFVIDAADNRVVRPDRVREGTVETHCLLLQWKWEGFFGDIVAIKHFSFTVRRLMSPALDFKIEI